MVVQNFLRCNDRTLWKVVVLCVIVKRSIMMLFSGVVVEWEVDKDGGSMAVSLAFYSNYSIVLWSFCRGYEKSKME